MKKIILFLLVLFSCGLLHAQEIDVLHYEYRLTLSDHTDEIAGEAAITIRFRNVTDRFTLDLASKTGGKGMTVKQILAPVKIRSYDHKDDRLQIFFSSPAVTEDTFTFYISYAGVPADGLIISKNKFGERTFFADNWPNRARHWIPCNDRPDDKASVDFYVGVPRHFQVISNGLLQNDTAAGEWETEALNKGRYYHWRETTPIPTKVMVIGAARFAVKEFEDSPANIPVSAWVYPQDSAKGFYDYALAVPILKFFQDYIGPYPYAKLANVQSKTIFGGMENASCIFYSEASVTGKRTAEALIAHEIAHQWFGNSATEKHFSHLWLSEGFATHMTNVYLEHIYGKDTVKERLKNDRDKIISFLKRNPLPVVDSTSELMDLLNANSYQKGGWVLRMIQAKVGDDNFRQIIRNYYENFAGTNATTKDLQLTVARVTGENWQSFFDQWLYRPTVPRLTVSWTQTAGKVKITVEQKGELYNLPLEFKVVMQDGRSFLKKETMHNQTMVIDAFTEGKVKEIIFDPEVKLLADFHVLNR